MVRRKEIRTRGKISLSKYFQKFKEGDSVAVKRDISLKVNFPKRIQGKTGIVEEKRGKAYLVKIKDISKEKQFLIEPIHLKKIKQIKK
ncbi:MAG TPA: 50S ribosomal protein L21e [Candidatus Nanoarchaeia archaeon]|nr:50S ribosomal protein L21e [Candidatus Nanoarchaeia archaeon]